MIYSDKVMDHFQNPRNVGVLKDADGVGQVGNPVCGDMMTFYIKVKDDRLADIKFQTFGCGAAIAVSSIVSEMALGKTLAEAMTITNAKVAEELGGLPKNKLHCSNLGADALHKAIEDYRAKKEGRTAKPAEEACHCPYCDGPLEGAESVCHSCQVELEECPECGKITNIHADKCVHCGTALSHEQSFEAMRADKSLDCYGLLCPVPIIQTARAMKDMAVGQVLEVQATDQGIKADIPAWCRTTGQEFLGLEEVGEVIKVYIKKVK